MKDTKQRALCTLLTVRWPQSFWSRVSFLRQRPCYQVCFSGRMRLCTKGFGSRRAPTATLTSSRSRSWRGRSCRFRHRKICFWCPFARSTGRESGRCTTCPCQWSFARSTPAISMKRGSTGRTSSTQPPDWPRTRAPKTPSDLQGSTSRSIELACKLLALLMSNYLLLHPKYSQSSWALSSADC